MSYKYVNGIYEVTTEIKSGYKRFHNCNAQHRTDTISDDNGRLFIIWDFISYATPICRVWYDTKWNVYYVTVNAEYYRCSPTTIKQFSRWLREINAPITYQDIKYQELLTEGGTPDISTVSFKKDVYISYCSDSYTRDKLEW